MSREIKFRAWYENVRRGEKVGDDIIWSKTSYYDYDPIIDNKGLCSVESGWDIQGHEDKNDYILEQYTGLKDKNGKEIYEGDIVNIQGIKYYVDFAYGGFWFNNDNRGWKANRPFTHFQEINDAEVIGNIHEDKDLLGGEDD